SAIYVEGTELSKVMFGIDIGAAELLLARQLGCDGVIAHHPSGGSAQLNYPEVLTRHVELMVEHGVSPTAARDAIQSMMTRALLRAQAQNFDHVPSVARLLEMPFLNVHLPLDEVGRRIMVDTIERHIESLGRPASVQDAIDALLTLPEFANAPTRIMVPVGAVDRPLGRVAVVHGAGTNGGYTVARTYFEHGVDSVLYIHVAPEEAQRLRADTRGNLIVSGHISSDMVGINQFVAKLEERGVEIVRMSGLEQWGAAPPPFEEPADASEPSLPRLLEPIVIPAIVETDTRSEPEPVPEPAPGTSIRTDTQELPEVSAETSRPIPGGTAELPKTRERDDESEAETPPPT
ncbi:MAG TPA: Nif3-like dinuclear metal center hexameric protein, partial [Nitrolancea sp.]